MRLDDEEQFEETRTESTGEQKGTGGLAEVRTGRGSAGLVRGRDEKCQADETSRKGKGKRNGGKGEYGNKGDNGGKRFQQSVKVLKGGEEEDKWVQVAPNMGAGGSYPQAMTDPQEEEEAEERRKGTRRPRWSDCEDDEGKEEERQQEVKDKKGQEKEKETRPEKGHEELTRERPLGLEQGEERRAQEVYEEQRRAQKALEQRMAQEEQEREAKV